jgi:hypothetical protein
LTLHRLAAACSFNMTIKITCPKCQKIFKVKDEMAGKRAKCQCDNLIEIPLPVAPPADIETFAASHLADAPEAVVEATFIEFECLFCNEKIKVGADLEGKQTPCPLCRKIIKVPLQKKELKDWRKTDPKLPSAAKENLPVVPEGAWSTRQATTVSKEALIEAAAIPIVKVKLTWPQRIRRLAWMGGAALAVAAAVLVALNLLNQNRQDKAIKQALDAVENNKALMPEMAAGILRGVGDYYIRSDVQAAATQASSHFSKARDLLAKPGVVASLDSDWVLIDLALSQVQLGGDKAQQVKRARLDWEPTAKEIRRTLALVISPEAREEAIRLVGRELIALDQGKYTANLPAIFPGTSAQLHAVLGLEFLRAGDEKTARQQAAAAQQLAAQPAVNGPPGVLIALWLALGNPEKATAVAPMPQNGKAAPLEISLGWAEGLARQGKWTEARSMTQGMPAPETRFAVLVGMAGVAIERDPENARIDSKEAFDMIKNDKLAKPPPWDLYHLGIILAQLDSPYVQEVTKRISEPALLGRAQLFVLRKEIAAKQDPVASTLISHVTAKTTAHGLAAQAVVAHNARIGGANAADPIVAELDPILKPFGQVGLALGLQAQGK